MTQMLFWEKYPLLTFLSCSSMKNLQSVPYDCCKTATCCDYVSDFGDYREQKDFGRLLLLNRTKRVYFIFILTFFLIYITAKIGKALNVKIIMHY